MPSHATRELRHIARLLRPRMRFRQVRRLIDPR